MEAIERDTEAIRLELAVCAAHPVHWFHTWAWTFDPRVELGTLPFDLWPRQEEFIRWLQERERLHRRGIVEKSRDSGATFLCAGYALHGWLFRRGFSAGFGSRKLELVDRKGDPDCIFEKIRTTLTMLPCWMLPQGFEPRHDSTAKLINPETGASITGEGGDEIGRGGRKTIYFVDESAFLEHPERIERSLSQTTNVRIDVSTPNGMGNPFYRRRHSGNTDVFTLHWRDDPRKDEAWYEAQKIAIDDPVTVAQELDIDYTASLEGVCIPARYVQAAVGLFDSPEFHAVYPDWQPSGDVTGGLDIADEGKNKNILITRRSAQVLEALAWGQMDTSQTAWKVRDEARARHIVVINYDVVGVGTGVKGTWSSADETLGFQTNPINGGDSPSEDIWPSGKTSQDLFFNLRAELWWKLRRRCERAYEFRTQGIRHRPEEMLSLPNVPELIADLSLPLYHHTETGKIRLEKKSDMQIRGVKSPDYGDACVYAFAREVYDYRKLADAVKSAQERANQRAGWNW